MNLGDLPDSTFRRTQLEGIKQEHWQGVLQSYSEVILERLVIHTYSQVVKSIVKALVATK